jgi:hypothetical protein
VTEQILHRKAHPEQAYRSCLGLQALARKYSRERIESACAHAVSINACTNRIVKSILEAGIDQVTLDLDADKPTPIHENVRGAAYYSSSFSTGKPNSFKYYRVPVFGCNGHRSAPLTNLLGGIY